MIQSNKIKGEGKPEDGCQLMREHSRAISNSGKTDRGFGQVGSSQSE